MSDYPSRFDLGAQLSKGNGSAVGKTFSFIEMSRFSSRSLPFFERRLSPAESHNQRISLPKEPQAPKLAAFDDADFSTSG